jgi:hypothetical protein
MFYALSTIEESYMADRVERFVALAPCVFGDLGRDTYQEIVEYYDTMMNKAGVLYSNGSDEAENSVKICKAFGLASKECIISKFDIPLFHARNSHASPMFFTMVHMYKNMIHPIYPDDYFSGDFEVEYVPLLNIDKVPITLMFMGGDTVCHMEDNMKIYN